MQILTADRIARQWSPLQQQSRLARQIGINWPKAIRRKRPMPPQRNQKWRSRDTFASLSANFSTRVKEETVNQQNIHAVDQMPSGKVVGFLGGGQLGRMAALAAANMGVRVKFLDPTPSAPASVAAEQVVGDFRDPHAIVQFAKQCDILTVEIEHVDVLALREVAVQVGTPVRPSPDTIEIIQDKYRQKMHFQSHGVPVIHSVEVDNLESLTTLCERRMPLMLKAKRLAYDGRGNYVIRSEADIKEAIGALGGFESGLYVEDWVPFVKELAVMVARSISGEIVSYPVTETIHKNSICFVTESPARISHTAAMRATQLAEKAVTCLDGSGIYGVEMFLLADGEVVVNEVAPRPHNSGHYTIDACYTSQFEQHIRAILGWPLGNTSLMVGTAIMLNVLGEAEGEEGLTIAQSLLQKALRVPGAKVHWYEKSNVQKDRKIGHINLIGSTRTETREHLKRLSSDAFSALASTQSEGATTDDGVPQVGIIMGSDSDLPTMKAAADVLGAFGIPVQVTVVSAHRTPERMLEYAKTAHTRGMKVIIAGAGGAAHLPGMVASLTPLPVIGVPCVPSGSHLDGLDALMSIVQMPKGVPVATVGIGNAANAGLLAARMLATTDSRLLDDILKYQTDMKQTVMQKVKRLESERWRHYS